LDVGCGSGGFLLHAQQAGWNAIGGDPDKAAVEQANRQGLKVSQGDLKPFADQQHIFDYISLCHVIEHVHDPVADIKNCYRLLKPGGELWIETPNINSAGYKKFGRNWRGIEAPRHLIIFNHNSLRQALLDAGFLSPKFTTRPLVAKRMFNTSRNIQNRKPIGTNRSTGKVLQMQAIFEGLLQELLPKRHEFITIIANKP
jgi:2-polyprenyl-3-methyl-5-hydroxy-6-metoxy-1,4-benzoquinol methylase